jgi:hypothetical protein
MLPVESKRSGARKDRMNRAYSVMVRAWSGLIGHSGALIAGLAVAWMASTPVAAWGQYWSQNGNSIYNTNGGNVGIGTTSPTNNLTIDQGTSATQAGSGVAVKYGAGRTVLFQGGDNAGYLYNWGSGGLYFYTNGSIAQTMAMAITNSGAVGIGTTTPQYLLSVNGTIGAKDIVVTNSGWPDFVFRPGYRLKPLSDVSAFITANHHLPDIPSEAEVKEKGVSVGEMQAKLLAKVEELTLHLIAQEKEIKELRQRIAQPESLAPGNGAPAAGR